MATTRAKFVCNSVTKHRSYNTKYPVMTTFKFSPVQGKGPDDENSKFWEYSPQGTFELTTTMLPADHFEVDKEYYLDIIPAEAKE